MKQFLILATIGLALASCNGSSSSSDSSKTSVDSKQAKEERNKQIVLASWDASVKRDADGTLKSAATDIIDYGDGSTPPIKGLDSLSVRMKKWMAASKMAFPDAKVSGVLAAASDDTVLVWSEVSAAWKREFMGQKPTGKSFRLYGVDYFVLNPEGKIIEHRATPGNAEIAKQIGMKM